MLTNLKYYKFTDPVTGTVTKDYGWTTESQTANLKIVFEDEGPKVLKNEPVKQTFLRRPKAFDLLEISESEFNALDTSNESMMHRLAREHNYLKIKKMQATPDKILPTSEEIIEHLKTKIA